MKKIYLILFTLLAGLTVKAQLTEANHAPVNGESFSTYQCDSTNISLVGSGPNTVWNYSSILTHSALQNNFSVTTATNPAYSIASVAVASSTNNVSYLKSSSTILNYYGGNISVGSGFSAVIATLNYTSPAVFAAYPMSLNTTTTSNMSGTINVLAPLTTTGTFSGSCSVIVDASGTLTLPGVGAIFNNVLRVVTSQVINFTTSIAPGTLTQVNYEYYANGIKAPVFTISTATAATALGTNTQTYVTRNTNPVTPTVTLLEDNKLKNNVLIYPNPASTFVSIVSENKTASEVLIYEITGKLIGQQYLTEGKVRLDVSVYNKGLYIYSIKDNKNQRLTTGKLVIQ